MKCFLLTRIKLTKKSRPCGDWLLVIFLPEYGCGKLQGKCREDAMYLMLAHLFYIEANWSGDAPALNGSVTETKIDAVSVSLQAHLRRVVSFSGGLILHHFGKTLAALSFCMLSHRLELW